MNRFLALLIGALVAAFLVSFFAPGVAPAPPRAEAQLWQQPVRPSPRCTRNSDCSVGTYCRDDGRCAAQCVENRDCGPGQRCVINPTGLGACVLDTPSAAQLSPDAPYCLSARDCTSGACNAQQQCQ